MKLKNFIFIISTILLSVVSIIFFITAFPWIFLFIGLLLSPNPAKPEITYGEFPFKLEYEIDGHKVVVEDTLICEYDGIGISEGEGKFRKWKEHLASGKERIVILKISDMKELYYTVGEARYYMGDYSKEHKIYPKAIMFEKDGTITSNKLIEEDELLEVYNIKLISWDYTKPIENKFS